MNSTKIEWTDRTWNPVSGCKNTCEYCYARKMANRLKGRFGYHKTEPFTPTLHPDRLTEPLYIKKPSKIFVCSMGDLFGEWVPRIWIEQVLDVVCQTPDHTFQFLTKNPKRYADFDFPNNAWMGYSTTGPLFHQWDQKHVGNVKFVSIEPIQGPMTGPLDGLDWIIVGAETGNRKGKIIPDKTDVLGIIYTACQAKIPVFVKNSISEDLIGVKVQKFPI